MTPLFSSPISAPNIDEGVSFPFLLLASYRLPLADCFAFFCCRSNVASALNSPTSATLFVAIPLRTIKSDTKERDGDTSSSRDGTTSSSADSKSGAPASSPAAGAGSDSFVGLPPLKASAAATAQAGSAATSPGGSALDAIAASSLGVESVVKVRAPLGPCLLFGHE